MLHLIAAVEHEQKRDDGVLATSTRREVALAAAGIGLDGCDEAFYIAALHRLSRESIGLAGVVVGWIVREVAADDEEVLVVEVRLEHLSHSLQLRIVVGGDDDWNDGWHLVQPTLQER